MDILSMLQGDNGAPSDLIKAIIAGDQTGRELTDQLSNGPALKPESLDPVLKTLQFQLKHLVLHNMIPKKSVYNTVHEYLQLVKYGEEVGIFMNEGTSPEQTDSQYRRKAALVKYMGLGGKLTHQAMLVKNADGKDPYTREVENKLIQLTKRINQELVTADSSKVERQFDGLFRQHMLGIGEIYGATSGLTPEQLMDRYDGDVAVIDARGSILTEAMIQDAADAVVNQRYGEVSKVITNPTVAKNFTKQFLNSKRIIPGISGSVRGAMVGQSVNPIETQFGAVDLESDIFFDRREGIAYNRAATSAKAPNAPTAGVAPIAVATDAKNKFNATFAGGYFYVVTAVNQYGESAPLVMNTTIQAVAATESVDLQFVDGGGSYPATAYRIYRTEKNVAVYQTAKYYPLFDVSTTELAAGYDGADQTKVRDRNRIIANTHSALVLAPSDQLWEYIQLAPTMKIEFAIVTLAKEFAIVNYGTPVLYMPGKICRIKNIGALTATA